MAGIRLAVVSAEIATGTSAKTLMQLVAAANHRVLVRGVRVSLKGVSASATPVLVRVLRQTTAGTMSALMPVKINSADDETLQTTAQHTATAEPTAGDVLLSSVVHPQGGSFVWVAPFGGELVLPGGGRLGVEVTAAASVAAVAMIEAEE